MENNGQDTIHFERTIGYSTIDMRDTNIRLKRVSLCDHETDDHNLLTTSRFLVNCPKCLDILNIKSKL